MERNNKIFNLFNKFFGQEKGYIGLTSFNKEEDKNYTKTPLPQSATSFTGLIKRNANLL